MTPLDSLDRQLRERLSFHVECLSRPGEDVMFHIGNIHALTIAMRMVDKVRPGAKYDE